MMTRVLPLLVLTGLVAPATLPAATGSNVKVTRSEDRVRVELGGQLFTEYIFKGATKPYLYPIRAKDGTEMMRHYPMKGKGGVPGEDEDHPHHRSMFFTHGDVNGYDFWAEMNGPKQGRIVNESVDASTQGNVGVIRSRNKWVNAQDELQCTDETVIRIHEAPEGRFVDWEVTLKAPADKPVEFRDTKEGSIAIRLPLWMTVSHSQGKGKKYEGKGTIVNAQGVKNVAAWGKRSEWVDYFAPKDGKVYGVALFDHPKNPRHPTWWHVRDYGLFAANPFGQHDFEGTKEKPLPAGAGTMTIPAGGSATFRWRFFVHNGDEKAGKIAEHYKAYAAGK